MIAPDDIVYISGPMTGLPDFNYPAFIEAERQLHYAYGCEVLNPAHLPPGLTWTEYMRLNVAILRRATVLYQLPGWGNSDGAVIEFDLSLMAGLLVLPLPESPRLAPKREPFFGVFKGSLDGPYL